MEQVDVYEVKRAGALRGAWLMVKESLFFIRNCKKVLVIPVATLLVYVLVLLFVGVALSQYTSDVFYADGIPSVPADYLSLYSVYVLFVFMQASAQAIIMYMVREYTNGRVASIKAGWQFLEKYVHTFLVFGLISAAAALFTEVLFQFDSIVTVIVSAVLMLLWWLYTYLVVQVITHSNARNIWKALASSFTVMKRVWKETLYGHMLLAGLFLAVSVVLTLIVATFLLVAPESSLFTFGIGIFFFGMVIPILLVSYSASLVFPYFLFLYAGHGDIPSSVSDELKNQYVLRREHVSHAETLRVETTEV